VDRERHEPRAGALPIGLGLKLRRRIEEGADRRRRTEPAIRHEMEVDRGDVFSLEIVDHGVEHRIVPVGARDHHVAAPGAVREGRREPRDELTRARTGIDKEPLHRLTIARSEQRHDTIRLPPSTDAALHAARTSSISDRDIHSVSNSSPSAR
jgi:hypothetical protein